ncbi:MAG: hypothetical protein M3I20_01590 [Mogibacterium diversum]|uniref:Uncharacterized protein n=1 Tax=Mogibacterium diversum TaxID=114527 RepID=A0A2S0L2G3_9FIRM|nr:hypothetical protein [Mogibacterium diversum]AVM47437.1 hypothetical protein C5Q96_00580 [Mogibacterium diversum]MBF1319755.1 hypothetical protein [Mogibacterium diversum]MBF1361409.1 hypothetical protein [Mogibacterium diversum]UQF81715.1 MAG: hypothetical protein M3I20_01590 [Mogibacterium diversum]
MIAITIIMAINIVALLFVPLSPLVFLSTLLMAKKYKKNDYGDLLSKKNRIVSFVVTVAIGGACVVLAYILPYHEYYPNIIRRLCETIGTINIYFAINIFITKKSVRRY